MCCRVIWVRGDGSLPKQSEQSSSAPDPFFDDSYSFHIHFFFLFIRKSGGDGESTIPP